jgi:hypothetical protein
MSKAELSKASCVRQLDDYASLAAQVNSRIEQTQAEIETLTSELQTAKVVRQHKEQYEALAILVNKLPSKSKTRTEQAAVGEELEKLKMEKKGLDDRVSPIVLHSSYVLIHEIARLIFTPLIECFFFISCLFSSGVGPAKAIQAHDDSNRRHDPNTD